MMTKDTWAERIGKEVAHQFGIADEPRLVEVIREQMEDDEENVFLKGAIYRNFDVGRCPDRDGIYVVTPYDYSVMKTMPLVRQLRFIETSAETIAKKAKQIVKEIEG